MSSTNNKSQNNNSLYQDYAVYSGIGFQLVACVLAGWLLGAQLDKLFNTRPVLLVICILLGMILGFVNIFTINKFYENKKNDEHKKPN